MKASKKAYEMVNRIKARKAKEAAEGYKRVKKNRLNGTHKKTSTVGG